MVEKIIEKESQFNIPKIGEIIQGKVIDKGKASVYLDLGALGTGIIYGKEFYEAKDKLKNLKSGDTTFAKITDLENEDGYIELSLNEARKELAWHDLSQKKEDDKSFKIKISGANKGGLLAEVSGIQAFVPVSQLSADHYPKVDGGDTQKILKELQKFIGKEIEVRVLNFNPREEKLILSEKAKETKKIEEALKNYKIGDVVEVEITGIADFGAFVKLIDNEKENSKKENKATEILEGLIHISELSWQLIKSPSDVVKIEQKLKAKIINISDNKISLSLKALKKDPWKKIEEKYKKGAVIKGKVIKLNPFGAFIQVSPEIQGLCHVSEFGSHKKMEEILKIGEEYDFQVSLIEPEKHRMSLKFTEKE